jgi:hypothetical protein
MGVPWTREAPVRAGTTLDELVSEAEARLERPRRHSDQAALWYCDWNDRVAAWLQHHPDRDARQAFFEIEFDALGPATVERKLALLRSLAAA